MNKKKVGTARPEPASANMGFRVLRSTNRAISELETVYFRYMKYLL